MIADFVFDSSKGIITINGSKPIASVTDLKIERKEGKPYATVTLKFDSNVIVNGKLNLPISVIGLTEKGLKEGECESPSK
ncbi:hypothetical protein PTL64_14680 [Clostridium perfringens]|nr:hypothetical protein [Clostridium perfringens]